MTITDHTQHESESLLKFVLAINVFAAMSYDDDGNYVSWMREEVARVSEDCVKRCDAVVVLVLSLQMCVPR